MDEIRPLYIDIKENPYAEPENREQVYTDDKLEEARKWSEENFTHIILPREANSSSINDIEKEYVKYSSLPHKQRHIADWKCMELFGKSNRDIYEEFTKNPRPNNGDIEEDDTSLRYDRIYPSSEAVLDMSDQVECNKISYTQANINAAKEWVNSNDFAMIIPCRTLEDLENQWDNYSSMLLKHRRVSDWESENIFGVSNQKHYEYLKKQFLKKDIDPISIEDLDDTDVDSSEGYIAPDHFNFIENYIRSAKDDMSNSEIVKTLFEATLYDQSSTYYMNGIKKSIKRILENEELCCRVDTDFLPCSDLPYYSPEEMIDMGVFSHVDADNFFGVGADNAELADGITTQNWFEAYKYHFNGFDTPNKGTLYLARLSKLTELCFGLRRMKQAGASKEAINARKQSILELGWNPDLEFTPENRIKTNKLYLEKCNSHVSAKVVNMNGFNPFNETEIVIDRTTGLKPFFVILTGGIKVRSEFIKMGTLSEYSHCSMALDSSLEEMYSYDTTGGDGSGGFVVENIHDCRTDQKLGVFVVFIKDNDMEVIKRNIEFLKRNRGSTSYSMRNLLSYTFHIIPPEKNKLNSFCSQFVDRLLKSIGVDITKRKSEFVSPATFDRVAKKGGKIFNIYEGTVGGYSKGLVDNKIKYLLSNNSKTTISIKEKMDIARSFLCHPDNLEEMAKIDINSIGNITRSIYETYIGSCFSIEEFIYESKQSIQRTMSMDQLDSMINIFGKK